MTLNEGLTGILRVLWSDFNGQPINSTEDSMLSDQVTSGQTTNRTISFDPIRTSDEGSYICLATLFSPTLSISLNSSALYVIDVQQSKI